MWRAGTRGQLCPCRVGAGSASPAGPRPSTSRSLSCLPALWSACCPLTGDTYAAGHLPLRRKDSGSLLPACIPPQGILGNHSYVSTLLSSKESLLPFLRQRTLLQWLASRQRWGWWHEAFINMVSVTSGTRGQGAGMCGDRATASVSPHFCLSFCMVLSRHHLGLLLPSSGC